MSTDVLRTAEGWWVEVSGRAVRVDTDASTTAALLADRPAVTAAADRAATGGDAVAVSDLALLSPVTTPCRLVAQMVNYRSHARESGFDPDRVLPTFFRKASGSIVGATTPIQRPAHVRLLDYEVELGLVLGRELTVGSIVTDADLPGLVAGLVVADDISARDVQLSKGQFYESKSYPTFTPLGPRLTLLDPADFARLPELRLRLSVNGSVRQDQPLTDMICPPAKALNVLARFQSLSPGDVLLTGTPGGTALQAPPKVVEKIAGLLPAHVKWKLFLSAQEKRSAYLASGDLIEASISTPDGAIDLGRQSNLVVDVDGTPQHSATTARPSAGNASRAGSTATGGAG